MCASPPWFSFQFSPLISCVTVRSKFKRWCVPQRSHYSSSGFAIRPFSELSTDFQRFSASFQRPRQRFTCVIRIHIRKTAQRLHPSVLLHRAFLFTFDFMCDSQCVQSSNVDVCPNFQSIHPSGYVIRQFSELSMGFQRLSASFQRPKQQFTYVIRIHIRKTAKRLNPSSSMCASPPCFSFQFSTLISCVTVRSKFKRWCVPQRSHSIHHQVTLSGRLASCQRIFSDLQHHFNGRNSNLHLLFAYTYEKTPKGYIHVCFSAVLFFSPLASCVPTFKVQTLKFLFKFWNSRFCWHPKIIFSPPSNKI